MKKLLLFTILLSMAQSSFAAVMRVKKIDSRKGSIVMIFWKNGKTQKIIPADGKYHIMDSGVHSITGIAWTGDNRQIYDVPLQISAVSLRHTFEIIGDEGGWSYDQGQEQGMVGLRYGLIGD